MTDALKLAAVAAILASEPAFEQFGTQGDAAGSRPGAIRGKDRSNIRPHPMAGAQPPGHSGHTSHPHYPIGSIISSSGSRSFARHHKAMIRIRRRWRLIGMAAIAITMWFLAMVAWHVIDGLI